MSFRQKGSMRQVIVYELVNNQSKFKSMSNVLRTLLKQLVCCSKITSGAVLALLLFQLFSPVAVHASILETSDSEVLVGPPNQPSITRLCTFNAFGNASTNHALVINNLPGISNPRFDFAAGQQGTIAFFSDGTARLTGRLVNKGDANQQWDMDFYFSDQMDWSTWSGLGRDWKNEGQGATNQYLDWEYFIFDTNIPSTLKGAGSLTGSSLVITHMPSDYHYGFQVGDYANCKNGNYGAAAWFFATGTVNGSSVSNQHGDINLNLGCRNVTKECPADEYASGSHILWLNNLPGGSGNNWVNIPGQNLSFLELAGGEAAIYGKVQNQNNNNLKLTVSYWFNQKANWATWSGNVPPRSWKGNAGIVGNNYLNWDYYIFNTSVASTLIGCSPATPNTYIVATHMPASYLYGLQVGTAANDKNANEGFSTWFFLNGKFLNNNVNGNQGDLNGNTNCAPPFLICIDTPPIITCPADVTIDCSASIDPSNTGVATSDRPNSECPGEVIISYSDVLSGTTCPNTITRTWTVVDEYGNEVSCTQTITIVDTTAPVLEMPAVTSGTASCDELSVEDAIAFGQGVNQNGFLQAARNLFNSLGLVPVGTSDDCNESEWIETGVEVAVGECPVKVTLTCYFVAVDACGNTSATSSSTISIVDETAPVITCPADITVDCSGSLDPMATGMASATDDCGDATVTYTDGAITGECPQTLVRTWTATDECGLTSTCTQTITIVDVIAPSLIMPAQTFINITCTAVNYGTLLSLANGDLTTSQANTYRNFLRNIFMTNGLVPTEADDNCSEGIISESAIQIITQGLNCPNKAIVRCVFIATDACGNVSDEQYTELIVIDQTVPNIFCPSDIVVSCGSDTSPSVTGVATATDNCSGPMEISYYDTDVTSFCPTSFVRVWVAQDGCGNTTTCEQLITLVDEDALCSTAPTGLNAEVTAPNTVLLTWNPVPGSIGCRILARAVGSSNTITVATIVGNAPSQYTAQSNLLSNGVAVQWRVICACSTNPLVTTPFSPWNTFVYNWNSNKSFTPDADLGTNSGVNLEGGRVYPNPTLNSTFLNTKMSEGDVIVIRDISGMTVTSTIAPADSDVLEIDLKRYAAGVYFIQHVDRSGIPHVYKVIKN